jgi:hypothetical protein
MKFYETGRDQRRTCSALVRHHNLFSLSNLFMVRRLLLQEIQG